MKTICAIILLYISYDATAQNNNLSASAKIVLHTIEKYQDSLDDKKWKIAPKLPQDLRVFTKNNIQYINVFIKVDSTAIDIDSLHILGVVVGTKAKDIWTVQVPINTFKNLSTLKGVKFLEIGGKIKLLLDEARKETKANEVYIGIGLSQAYWGDSVIIGIIDNGFDYTHPTFYDSATGKCRISRVWNQLYDEQESGLNIAPPAGYNYGMELIDLDKIIKNINVNEYNNKDKQWYLCDDPYEFHGTHVAGVATGSGWKTNGKYQGIAPKSEIVMVTYRTVEPTNVIDAIQYIFNYAASVNKPAVINMSFGVVAGPHDGTSLVCQAINNLTGQGKIIVAAAGNEGGKNAHLSHTFQSADTVFTSLGYVHNNVVYTKLRSPGIDCWGSAETNFSAKVMVYKDGNKWGETSFIPASLNAVITDTIVNGVDTVYVKAATEAANPNNNKPNILFEIDAFKTREAPSFQLAFAGNNTTINAWSIPGFLSIDQPKYIKPDDLYSIMDSQTAENLITVGAYTTRNKYININGKLQNFEDEEDIGNITFFSSKGPTIDGRTKPDITAPGSKIISSISSFISEGPWADIIVYSLISPVNGRTYKFLAEDGTSLASPVVTGAVALMLQANPALNPQQVLSILKSTARKDNFTGNIPASGSNIWGWGKIDIHAAVKEAEATRGPKHVSTFSQKN